MNWCDTCSAYRSSSSSTLAAGAVCTACGHEVDESRPEIGGVARERSVGQSAPWHFWLVVAMLAAYLGWRLIQGVAWLF